MRILTPIRLSAMLAGFLLLAGSAASAARVLADPRPGEYGLGLTASAASVPEGGEAVIAASIEQSGEANYQAVQWDVEYDENVIAVRSIDAVSGAPKECGSKNDNGARVLLGCLDLTGTNLSYSGKVFNVKVECIAGGEARFQLVFASVAAAHTFVKNGNRSLPVHTHDATLTCGGAAPAVTTTSTATAAPVVIGTRPAGVTPTPGSTTARATPPVGSSPAASGTATGPDTGPGSSKTAVAGQGQTQGGTPVKSVDRDASDDGGDSGKTWLIVVAIVAGAVVVGGGGWYVARRRSG